MNEGMKQVLLHLEQVLGATILPICSDGFTASILLTKPGNTHPVLITSAKTAHELRWLVRGMELAVDKANVRDTFMGDEPPKPIPSVAREFEPDVTLHKYTAREAMNLERSGYVMEKCPEQPGDFYSWFKIVSVPAAVRQAGPEAINHHQIEPGA